MSAVKSEQTVKKKKRIDVREMQLYSMAALPVLLVLIFEYLPMVGIIIAFKDYKFGRGIFGSEWIGFDNFKFFFASNEFGKLIRNTLGMNFIFIVLGMLSAILLAFTLYELNSRKLTKVFQTTLITPNFISWVVASYMVYGFLNPISGIANNFLENVLHLDGIDWYSIPGVWPFVLTVCSIWKHIGMDSVLYYAALMGFDSSLKEAAEVDGANKRQINTKIILPSLVPMIVVLAIMKVGNIFRADFGLFYQIPRDIGVLYPTTDVIDTYIFRAVRVIGDMGMGSAVGLLQSVVGCLLVIFTNFCANRVDESLGLF